MGKFLPSKYQKAVFDEIVDGLGHMLVEAVAGSGKTTTILQAIELIDYVQKRVLFCAFNKSIEQEIGRRLQERGVRRVTVKTYHALGLAVIGNNLKTRATIHDAKLRDVLRELVPDYDERRAVDSILTKIIGLCKGLLLHPTRENIVEVVDRYSVDTNGQDLGRLVDLATAAMMKCLEMETIVDFDDMIWIPALKLRAGQWRATKYDWILSDESQDLNEAQRQILISSLAEGGRLVAVGDSRQAIYGFRGADPESMTKLKDRLGAKSLPLSVCYRCPTSHLDLARTVVPSIEPRPRAPAGSIENLAHDKLADAAIEGDLVLCRRNAPLVSQAFKLIARGRKAVVKGRDIGSGLSSLVEKLAPRDMDDLFRKLDAYRSREIEKAVAADKPNKVEQINDKVDCIEAVAENVATVAELGARINTIFSDQVGGVVFSSVHRAKGLEAERVFILEFDRMPMTWARQKPWELAQEQNIYYVAVTRSKDKLFLVATKPKDGTSGRGPEPAATKPSMTSNEFAALFPGGRRA